VRASVATAIRPSRMLRHALNFALAMDPCSERRIANVHAAGQFAPGRPRGQRRSSRRAAGYWMIALKRIVIDSPGFSSPWA